jgi:anti-sigma regulatory factor (Ser/Thr protein kinase)
MTMTSKPGSPTRPTQPTTSTPRLTTTPDARDHTFAMSFTSTPRGVRLARRLAALRLDAWGIPYDTPPHDEIVLIVAELTANAVRHGRVPGRDFHLRLHVNGRTNTARIEVTDTRAERLPLRPPAEGAAVDDEETGRGLLLVSHLAARWDWRPRPDRPGKTVWAEYVLVPSSTSPQW